MANVAQETYHERRVEERYMKGESLAEGITGGAGVILAIIGLANILPSYMLPIAVIAIGSSFVFEGGAVATRFSKLLTEASKERSYVSGLGSGLTAEVIAGVTGIILGVLTLLNVAPPMSLMPVAAIVFGSTLIFSSGTSVRLDEMFISRMEVDAEFKEVAREAVSASSGVQLLFGISAITLGVLALVGIGQVILTLVALLGIGLSNLLNGVSISTRMLTAMRPHPHA